jgi:DNA-binding transcriptional regulator LsrR (DeoR family)
MHKIRQILLLFLECGVSQRTVEKEVKISRKTIGLYLSKFHQSGVCFSELLKQSDQQLEQLLGLNRTTVPQDNDPRKVHFYFRRNI